MGAAAQALSSSGAFDKVVSASSAMSRSPMSMTVPATSTATFATSSVMPCCAPVAQSAAYFDLCRDDDDDDIATSTLEPVSLQDPAQASACGSTSSAYGTMVSSDRALVTVGAVPAAMGPHESRACHTSASPMRSPEFPLASTTDRDSSARCVTLHVIDVQGGVQFFWINVFIPLQKLMDAYCKMVYF